MSKKIKFIFLGIILTIIAFIICVFFVWSEAPDFYTKTVLFNKTGNIAEFKTHGFSGPEENITWTNDKEAFVSITMPKVQENHRLVMSVDGMPFLSPKKLKKQNIKVFVNDVLVDKWVLDKSQFYNFIVLLPQNIQDKDNNINVKFQISNPKSPKELKLSNDARKLGFALRRLVLTEMDINNTKGFPVYSIGKEISFVKGKGNSQKYTGSGWSDQEKNFTWTDGKDAYINMFVKDSQNKTLQLNVFGRCIFDSVDSNQKVTVFINNKELTTWNCTNEDKTYNVIIPSSVVGDGFLEIRFNIEKPFVPKPDIRKLGFAVKNISISERFGAKLKSKITLWLKNNVFKPSDKPSEK